MAKAEKVEKKTLRKQNSEELLRRIKFGDFETARPLRVKIVGTHITGAPIQAIASQIAGTFYKVEGEVNLNPVEGHRYFVMGKLAKDASKVWILDPEVGSVPVTEVVESRPK